MNKILDFLVPSFIKHIYRYNKYNDYKEQTLNSIEFERIQRIPRFQGGITNILDKPLMFVDAASFLFIYKELFEQEIYKFRSDNNEPYIIDAGANIGLAAIYFKQLYPNAKVIAFEPDPEVFKVLKENIQSFDLKGVTLIPKALWDKETELTFYQEGADGGRVAIAQDTKAITKLPTTRLKQYLKEPVDFLKIDIEGAETKVLEDCADLLVNVKRIFVEYHSFVGQEQSLPALLETLKKAGFRLNINTPGLISKQPLHKIDTYAGMDMQLNIYGYR